MPSLPAKASGRPIRWLGTIALLALVPKCVACLAAYVGVGVWLGIKLGPEICGGTATTPGSLIMRLLVSSVVVGLIIFRRRAS